MSGSSSPAAPAPAPTSSVKFKKKTGAQQFKEQNILSSTEATDLTASKCAGVLRGEGAIVTSKPDVVALLKLGSYGKGVFSRSVPCHGVMPSFVQPSKRKRKKMEISSSQSVLDTSSPGLTRSEQQMVGKMSKFLNGQEKRMALHEEWKKEADQSTAVVSHLQVQDEPIASGVSDEECTSRKNTSEPHPLTFSEHRKQFQKKWQQLEETDPYRMDEYLQLSSEEALYLSHDLKLLDIIDDSTGKTLSANELWATFYTQRKFFGKYAAYRYYRKKGWIPKSGIKYGVDFVLYKQGPVEYHSNYAIIVRLMTETGPSPETSSQSSKDELTWRDVVAFDRVCSSVVKDLILCHVIVDDSLKGLNTFPDCLEKLLKIVEVSVKRWDPDKNR